MTKKGTTNRSRDRRWARQPDGPNLMQPVATGRQACAKLLNGNSRQRTLAVQLGTTLLELLSQSVLSGHDTLMVTMNPTVAFEACIHPCTKCRCEALREPGKDGLAKAMHCEICDPRIMATSPGSLLDLLSLSDMHPKRINVSRNDNKRII